jgi:hypothetical protein
MDASNMSAIFNQAILFFTLFGAMSIISYIFSKRSAKKYEVTHPLNIRIKEAREEELVSNFLNTSAVKIMGKKATLFELTKELKDGIINEEEFKILKKNLNMIKI